MKNAKVWLHLRDRYDKGLECQQVCFLPFLFLSERQISVSYFRLVSSCSSPVYRNLLTLSPESKLLVEFSGPKCKTPGKVPSVGQGDSDVHPMLWQQRQATQEDATTTGITCLEKGKSISLKRKGLLWTDKTVDVLRNLLRYFIKPVVPKVWCTELYGSTRPFQVCKVKAIFIIMLRC